MDAAVGEAPLGPVLVVDRREEVGRREHVAQREEHPLGAAHIDQEVVHERDPRPCWPRLLRHEAREPIDDVPARQRYRAAPHAGRRGRAPPHGRARRRPLHARAARRARRRAPGGRVARVRPRPRPAAAPCPAGVRLVRHALPGRVLFGAAAVARRPRLDRLLGGVDVVWAPAPAPLALSAGVPLVLTVHDRSFEERPGDFTRYERAWHRLARPRALAARAAAVVCDADAVRADIARAWGVDATVVSPGPLLDRTERARARAAVNGGTPYLLFVGALEPRKAPDVLAAGYARARERGLAADLVVVGDGRIPIAGPGIRHVPALGDDGAARRALRRRARGRRALVARGLRPAAGRGGRAGNAERRQRPARVRRDARRRGAARRARRRRGAGRGAPGRRDRRRCSAGAWRPRRARPAARYDWARVGARDARRPRRGRAAVTFSVVVVIHDSARHLAALLRLDRAPPRPAAPGRGRRQRLARRRRRGRPRARGAHDRARRQPRVRGGEQRRPRARVARRSPCSSTPTASCSTARSARSPTARGPRTRCSSRGCSSATARVQRSAHPLPGGAGALVPALWPPRAMPRALREHFEPWRARGAPPRRLGDRGLRRRPHGPPAPPRALRPDRVPLLRGPRALPARPRRRRRRPSCAPRSASSTTAATRPAPRSATARSICRRGGGATSWARTWARGRSPSTTPRRR